MSSSMFIIKNNIDNDNDHLGSIITPYFGSNHYEIYMPTIHRVREICHANSDLNSSYY